MVSFFFVCGAPKSGTTWLQRLLDSHPQIACSGEGHFIEFLLKPMVGMYDRYQSALDRTSEQVYSGEPFYTPISRELVIQTAKDWMVSMMSRRLEPGITCLGDKTPYYTHNLRELRVLFPGSKIVSICRDPRDVVVSRLYHAARAGHSDALVVGSDFYRSQINTVIEDWLSANARIATHAHHLPDEIIQLRYEDMIAKPEQEAARLFRFLAVDDDAETTYLATTKASFRSLSGRDRGEEDTASFFRKGVVGDWHNRLDDVAISLIETRCEEQMLSLGYRANLR